MSPIEALRLLDAIVAGSALDRQTHTKIQEAVNVLGQVINEWNELKSEKQSDVVTE